MRGVVYLKKPKGAKSNFRDFEAEAGISLKFLRNSDSDINASDCDDVYRERCR